MASSSKIFLSVLIPVYRSDISLLLVKLIAELHKSGCIYEIIVFDDSAESSHYAWHSEFRMSEKLRIHTSEHNKGRSASRNFLLDQAKGNCCLFLDGDMQIKSGFIRNYLSAMEKYPDAVLLGGISYETQSAALRIRMGTSREQNDAVFRQKRPYRAFTAANVWLPEAVMRQFRFDPTITSYGHEDTIFGLNLLENKVAIRHIDNPATHLGIDSDEVYWDKIEAGITTLAGLWCTNPLLKKHKQEVKLLHFWCKLKPFGVLDMLSKPWLMSKIRSKATSSLFWMDWYKLVFLHRQIKRLAGHS